MYVYTYTCKLQTIAVHLKTMSFVAHKLYFNLYGTFPVKWRHFYLYSALYIVSKILHNNINIAVE